MLLIFLYMFLLHNNPNECWYEKNLNLFFQVSLSMQTILCFQSLSKIIKKYVIHKILHMIQMNYWLLNPYNETFIMIWKMNKKMNIDNFQNFKSMNHKLKILIDKTVKWVIIKFKNEKYYKNFGVYLKKKIMMNFCK